MAIDYEDFVRCENCQCADFVEEKYLTIPKLVKKRESDTAPLEGVSVQYQYTCAKCMTVIDK